jgi:hypothetical protein
MLTHNIHTDCFGTTKHVSLALFIDLTNANIIHKLVDIDHSTSYSDFYFTFTYTNEFNINIKLRG